MVYFYKLQELDISLPDQHNSLLQKPCTIVLPKAFNDSGPMQGHQRRIQDRRAGRPPPPRFKKNGIVFKNVDCIQTFTLILINIQCLQYVFYSLLLLQNIGYTCVKGHQNRPKNSTAPGPRRPILKFLDQPLNSIESFPLIRVITTRE